MYDLNVLIYSGVATLGGLTGLAILSSSQKRLTVRALVSSFLLPSLISFAVVGWYFGEIKTGDNRVAPLALSVLIGCLYSSLTVPQISAAILATIGGRLGVLARVAAELILNTKDGGQGDEK